MCGFLEELFYWQYYIFLVASRCVLWSSFRQIDLEKEGMNTQEQ